MDHDVQVIKNFARAHFAAMSFISTACGLVAGSLLAVYGSRIGFHSATQPATEFINLLDFSVTQAGAFACGGFLAGWIPGFFAGKFAGFILGYPLKVNANLLLLAINIEQNAGRPSGMPGSHGGSVLDFKRSA